MNPAARAGVVALLLLPLVLLVAAPSSATGSRTKAGHRASHVSRTLRLEVPTGLALAPDGDLFIADQWLEQIVERQPDGRFRVVAGTGRPGFRGDGGPATRAELDTPTALVRAADGTLYFIDQGNQRVRALLPDGKIVTVAGGGPLGASTIASGTPATEVSFSPSNLTIGPGGDLYVTAGDEVLRLSPSGLFTVMADASNFLDVVRTYQGSCGTDAIAFDRAGLLWVGCDNSRQLLAQQPGGGFSVVDGTYRPHDFAGLAAGPDGSMIVADGESLSRVSGGRWTTLVDLSDFTRSNLFVPGGVAVAANGAVYTDSSYGDGFTSGAGLGEVLPSGKFELLNSWKSHCAGPGLC